MSRRRTLILGGVRSGKSRLAEQLARDSGLAVCYIATADAGDDPEMAERIAAHKARRPRHWQLVEEPMQLAAALENRAHDDQCLLVDCLTLWLTNLLFAGGDSALAREREQLRTTLPSLPGRIILVSNETSMGITPMGEASRRYCDEAGHLHQELAAICDSVVLTVAGLPTLLKGETL